MHLSKIACLSTEIWPGRLFVIDLSEFFKYLRVNIYGIEIVEHAVDVRTSIRINSLDDRKIVFSFFL